MARINEDTSMETTAIAIDPRKSPAAPGSMTSGMNESTVVSVEESKGMRMRDTAAFIASTGEFPAMRRLRISSVITIDPSTNSPSATTRPVTDIC